MCAGHCSASFVIHCIIHDHLNYTRRPADNEARSQHRVPLGPEPYGKPMKNANIFGKFGVPNPVTGSQPFTA